MSAAYGCHTKRIILLSPFLSFPICFNCLILSVEPLLFVQSLCFCLALSPLQHMLSLCLCCILIFQSVLFFTTQGWHYFMFFVIVSKSYGKTKTSRFFFTIRCEDAMVHKHVIMGYFLKTINLTIVWSGWKPLLGELTDILPTIPMKNFGFNRKKKCTREPFWFFELMRHCVDSKLKDVLSEVLG